MGTSPYSVHVPRGFAGRAGFDVNKSHIFLHGVLSAITLVRGGPEDVGARLFANIFSHSVGCLFVLLMVSITV